MFAYLQANFYVLFAKYDSNHLYKAITNEYVYFA